MTNQYFVDTELHRPSFESLVNYLSISMGFLVIKWEEYWPFFVFESHSVMSNSLRPHGLHSPWNSLGQNTGVGSLSLLQGIFLTQESNQGLLHCRRILYQLSHKGSLRILEWVAYPFSRGSSWPRNQTRVSCIAGGFFTNGAMREALYTVEKNKGDNVLKFA